MDLSILELGQILIIKQFVAPALSTEAYIFKPTATQIERNTIYISKSRSVIKRLRELGIPKIVEGRLVDDELLFKF